MQAVLLAVGRRRVALRRASTERSLPSQQRERLDSTPRKGSLARGHSLERAGSARGMDEGLAVLPPPPTATPPTKSTPSTVRLPDTATLPS